MSEHDEVRVAGAATLDRGDAKVFEAGGKPDGGFVVGTGEGVVAYQNACPHIGFDLDMGTAEFYVAKLDRLYCRVHGATFEIETGLCDRGPCSGQSLVRLRSRVDGDDVVVDVPAMLNA
ncbi:MAG: Rieske 2Fe-2S domain-containing protein [Myxococcota bacterium]